MTLAWANALMIANLPIELMTATNCTVPRVQTPESRVPQMYAIVKAVGPAAISARLSLSLSLSLSLCLEFNCLPNAICTLRQLLHSHSSFGNHRMPIRTRTLTHPFHPAPPQSVKVINNQNPSKSELHWLHIFQPILSCCF